MDQYNLDQPLIELVSPWGKANFTTRMSVEGCAIFGGIGSGKTSGSGRMLAIKYLSAGWGGLILTVKPDEKAMWQEYCQVTDRERDLIIIEPGGNQYFNFLNYETSQASGKESLTDNVVELLKTVIRAGQEQSGGKSDDPFWEQSLDMLIFYVIDLCKLAYGQVTVSRMFEIVQTIPQSIQAMQDDNAEGKTKAFQQAFETARQYVTSQIDKWIKGLTPEQQDAFTDESAYEAAILDALPDARLLKDLDQFFFDRLMNLSDKTRSVIEFSFAAFLFRLLRDPVYSLFCRYPSTLIPEDSLTGKIILINLPVKLYHKVGRDVQILFKYIWQRAMEKRDIRQNGRPVFLWADEAQNFIHERDADFQATARSSRVATVYISQNLPNYYACMGGQKSEYRVKSFLGTLGTKIFHANADIETNKYASELIGDAYFEDQSESVTVAQNFAQTRSKALKLERQVRPEQFVSLATGGPRNNMRVEAYLHRQGHCLIASQNFVRTRFNQNFKPN